MSRKVVEGEKQLTASVWIISNSNPKKLLLVHHKKMGKWQQPGGHVDLFENPVEAAVREVREETGLDIGFLLKQIRPIDEDASFLPIPDFFMEQTIFPNADQPKHFHLDINYVVRIPEQEVSLNEKETHGIGWFTKEEIAELQTHGDTKVIVEKLL
jgi:8-oxo-dGTP pyrophosphatase MutT (NUDIX family)